MPARKISFFLVSPRAGDLGQPSVYSGFLALLWKRSRKKIGSWRKSVEFLSAELTDRIVETLSRFGSFGEFTFALVAFPGH